jgi:hypothetical protein
MKTFKDLVFTKYPYGLINGTCEFPNGFSISVSAGKMPYCTPREDLDSEKDYSSFEVALKNSDGDFVTGELLQNIDDVVGWCGREDINNMMELVAEQ